MGAVLFGKDNVTHRLAVPHFSDTFTKTLSLPREWFVNEDRSKAISKFVLKPLTIATNHDVSLGKNYIDRIKVTVKDVENGDATQIGGFRWTSPRTGSESVHNILNRQRAGTAYCERTKSGVSLEWR